MNEHWINPVAWSPKLVDHLLDMGWKVLQLDLEGGSFSTETIAWIVDSMRAKKVDLVVRVPADETSRVAKLARQGVRKFLVPGLQSHDALLRYVDATREGGDDVRVVPMIETRAWMDRVSELAIDGVSGVHFGVVDLCRDLGISQWRDVAKLPSGVLDAARTAADAGLTVGTYMLPQWHDSSWHSHFNVLSFSLPEFAAFNVSKEIITPLGEKK